MRFTIISFIVAFFLVGCVSKPPEKKDPHAGLKMPPGMTKEDLMMSDEVKGGLDLDNLMVNLPSGWTRQEPSSQMRAAQISIAAASGDKEPADLAVFFFPGTGGSSAANIQRWQGQMTGPKGEPGADVAKTDTMMVGLLTVITTDLSGTLLGAASMTGGMGGEPKDKPNMRMLASVIETPSGNWFVKIVGPQKTIAANEANIRSFLKKARVKGLS
jgi:hypothetical protein